MKTRYQKAITILLIATLLLAALPVVAWGPEEAEAIPGDAGVTEPSAEEAAPEVDANVTWVPTGKTPGFYAARDNRNLDPEVHALVGGHQSFYWNQLEPLEGQYEWQYIENFIAAEQAAGKSKVGIGIITFNGRQNQYNPGDPPIRVPSFVFAAGATKVTYSGGYEIPEFWNQVYQQKYENFIHALAQRYDGDPRIEFIQIGVGKYGETEPCDDEDSSTLIAALEQDNDWIVDVPDPDGTDYGSKFSRYDWPKIVNRIVKLYADHFNQTQLLLPNAPTLNGHCDRRLWGDYAVQQGVGLFPAGLMAIQEYVDQRTKAGFNGCGLFDRILDQAGTDNAWVPLAHEAYYYMTPTGIDYYWGILAALSRRIDYITVEYNTLYDTSQAGNPARPDFDAMIDAMRWAGNYMGKHVNTTPSVWVAMRESGYIDSWYPQKGNYTWWLTQDDNVSGGRTVVTTYLSKSQLVMEQHYTNYGGDAIVRASIETGQSFLGPSKEGWICRRTDQANNNNRYMWFKIDNRYINAQAGEATVTVTYLDRGTDTWQLVYDAASDPNKVAGTITKTNSGQWREATFHLTDAYFGNRQTGSSDFRIDCMADGNEYIHMVDVAKGTTSGDTHSINLTAANGGWNFVSARLVPTSTAIAQVLSSIAGKYDIVQAYVGGQWQSYTPGGGGTLSTLDQKQGFWIHVTQDCTLNVSGTAPTTTTINLTVGSTGWNMIGWPSDNSTAIATALAGIAGKYDVVYAYDAYAATTDPWKIYNPTAPSYANDLTQMSSGKAYWIHVTQNCDLTVNY